MAPGNTIALWNRTTLQVAAPADLSLLQNARLLALLNLAMADASVCAWDAKYHYAFWRPITAIQLADTDGNPDTASDASWTPLLATPPFPDYPSNHACTSGAAATVLAGFFGDETPFWATSETLPGATRYFTSFSEGEAGEKLRVAGSCLADPEHPGRSPIVEGHDAVKQSIAPFRQR